MSRPSTDQRQRGMAAMEAILALPVVVVVFVLLFNFSAAVIQKTRVSVGAREAAFRHLIEASSEKYDQKEAVYARVIAPIKDEIRRPGWTHYTFRDKSFSRGFRDLTGENNRDPKGTANDVRVDEGEDDGGSGFAGFLNNALGALGGQRDFTVWIKADHPFEGATSPWSEDPIFPPIEMKGYLAIDTSPWTQSEYPCGYLDILTRALQLPSHATTWLGC